MTLEIYVDAAVDAQTLVAPNGSICIFRPSARLVHVPPPIIRGLEHTRADSDFGLGRAGMAYRELLPSRAGGAVVASHIRVGTDGPVPDYVHFHRIRFQMIYCVQGWAKLVYEDNGPPSIMRPGDCVIQPPTMRHRVLESGGALEVVEISCPAEHETIADPHMVLPTSNVRPDREWHGQRFSWHRREGTGWLKEADGGHGWLAQDLGTHTATGGIGAAAAYTAAHTGAKQCVHVDTPTLVFIYIVRGGVEATVAGDTTTLAPSDSLSVPPEAVLTTVLTSTIPDTELLLVKFPVAMLE